MKIEEKYIETYIKMNEIINTPISEKRFPALGYTSNLDILCDFQVDILNKLLEEYMQGANLKNMKAPKIIKTMEDFISTLVFFCGNGIGGEVDVEEIEVIEKCFTTKYGIGGTATQAAMALAAVRYASIVHLTDDSKEVCDILESPYIYIVSPDGKLFHTNEVVQSAEQEKHFIIQFQKGDVIRLGNQEIMIPVSNRLIVTKITVNEFVPFSKHFFEYIENHAQNISSNILSSFNALKDQGILQERLNDVRRHIKIYKTNNEKGIVYFEDAHYHSSEIKKMCLETIYSHVDIISLNEEELAYTLTMNDYPVDIDDIVSCVEGAKYLREKYQIQKGVIVHTKDYSMYVGDQLEADIESGLIYGNMLATAKAMFGWYGSSEQILKVLELPMSEKGMRNREMILASTSTGTTIIVPSKYIDKPKYTIGLGDSFVAGVQICFM